MGCLNKSFSVILCACLMTITLPIAPIVAMATEPEEVTLVEIEEVVEEVRNEYEQHQMRYQAVLEEIRNGRKVKLIESVSVCKWHPVWQFSFVLAAARHGNLESFNTLLTQLPDVMNKVGYGSLCTLFEEAIKSSNLPMFNKVNSMFPEFLQPSICTITTKCLSQAMAQCKDHDIKAQLSKVLT